MLTTSRNLKNPSPAIDDRPNRPCLASQQTRNPEVTPILTDLNRMADVSQRMVVVAEKLPIDIAKERQATIDQLLDRISVERKDTINQIMQELARDVSGRSKNFC
jgi:hypothetical protein